ncbi:hypothetical protein M433DRAFT_157809 [Acidomyces richmondensis BFW]|nr:MAG: hypothetical protein FE78DRAFT_84365 [Acidomyces sp. 'richmondensis']KYG42509.1 hypothetical protein M433DRAFT_157809 [Acidomyces richmondensis BFW]
MESTSEGRPGQGPSSASFVQVCDRCRWKKIKCDGGKPCSNCRAVGFPCETRARLSKQATPRSYVQYLEARVRQLEGEKDNEWGSRKRSQSDESPYTDASVRKVGSSAVGSTSSPHGLPDWTTLRELGSHVVDEEGYSRYMGPSSGVGFVAMVIQEILPDDTPEDADFHSLFALDDSTRHKWLADSDMLLWQVRPENLPVRNEANRIVDLFFTFTERVYPVLHRPTFKCVVNQLYATSQVDPSGFEQLAQLYFVLSIGYCFDFERDIEDRVRDQIRALQTACRCLFTTLHRKRNGLMRLQTLALHSYALLLLRQRSESVEVSATANVLALEIGLHHDGQRMNGNPLETEMRRRVFWCVFILHLCNSSLQGLPRALHEADIQIAEPSDVDDEQLTTTEIRPALPGKTKIHRFISVCRLARILSRSLDVLYTHNKRKFASTKIEQMNRICCEHLLDQLDFSFEEVPDDLPEADSEDIEDLAMLASFVNEHLLYHYIRWLIHRPGLALPRHESQFAACLQNATEAASALLRTSSRYSKVLPYIKIVPGGHPLVIFAVSLTPLYRSKLLHSGHPWQFQIMNYSSDDDYEACTNGITALSYLQWNRSDSLRKSMLESMIRKVFGERPVKPQRGDSGVSGTSQQSFDSQTSDSPMASHQSQTSHQSQPAAPLPFGGEPSSTSYTAPSGTHSGGSGSHYQTPSTQYHQYHMEFQQERLEDMTANENLRNFVHEAFSPTADPWSSWEFGGSGVEPSSSTPRPC